MLGGALQRPFDEREVKYRLKDHLAGGVLTDTRVSLIEYAPARTDQDGTNSCVAYGTSYGVQILRAIAGLDTYEPSKSWLWTRCRQKQNFFPGNIGTYPADACDLAMHRGIPSTVQVPENTDPTVDPDPTEDGDDGALLYKFLAAHQPFYGSDAGGFTAGLIAALQLGKPVLLAMHWQQEFFNVGADGKLPPYDKSKSPVFEHLVCCIEWDHGWARAMNSWGNSWGVGGDFLIPVEYLSDGTIWEARALSPAPVGG